MFTKRNKLWAKYVLKNVPYGQSNANGTQFKRMKIVFTCRARHDYSRQVFFNQIRQVECKLIDSSYQSLRKSLKGYFTQNSTIEQLKVNIHLLKV